VDPAISTDSAAAALARKALAGFFLSGMLMSFVGAILPAWGYHLGSEFSAAGLHFLSLNVGILVSAAAAQHLLKRKGIAASLTLGASVACGAFLFLGVVGPPMSPVWRIFGVFWIGAAAGLLNAAVFHAISPIYQQDRAATVNLSGVLFGLGCLVTALLVAATFYVFSVPAILVLLALIPLAFAIIYARSRFPEEHSLPQAAPDVATEFRSPMAILLSLLLFFQFGNEWAIAGWLTLFLNQRLGISPASSLLLLAVYWLALMVGRLTAQVILPKISHARLLMGSALAALFGLTILTFTDNRFGALVGILTVGAGFALIYPLVVERIGAKFPYYHPGYYNGIFSIALTGGLLAPWSLGYIADIWGIGVVMLLPLAGTCMVFLLLLLIWLEAKLSGVEGLRSGVKPTGG
jgi:fucose permease